MIRLALLVALCVLAGVACGGSDGGDGPPPGPTELTSVDQLRSAFEDDAGAARLVLLLSPT